MGLERKEKLKSGIYCIKNKTNEKVYIGQTNDLDKRKGLHYSYLKNNTHDNPHLQNAWNKYGENNFEFKILLYCEPFELTRYEQFFVNVYTPEILYNIRLECVDSNLGVKHTKEDLEKMRNANLGSKNPMYGKTGEKHHLYGKPCSEETKKKLSESKKGVPMDEETKRKISKALSGRRFSDEHKKNLSENKKKYWEKRKISKQQGN